MNSIKKYIKYIPVNTQSQLYEVHSPYRVISIQLDYFHPVFEVLRVISVITGKIIF